MSNLVINIKPQNKAVVNIKPQNRAVINTKPQNQSLRDTNFTYMETRSISKGQPMLLWMITYPTDQLNFPAIRI